MCLSATWERDFKHRLGMIEILVRKVRRTLCGGRGLETHVLIHYRVIYARSVLGSFKMACPEFCSITKLDS